MTEAVNTTIGALVSSGALEFGDGYRTKRSEHGQPGYRIIRVADVMDDSVSFDGPDFVSELQTKTIGAKLGRPGDILLTTKGTVGRVAILPETDETIVYSPQLCYFRVADPTRISHRYLRYWFSSTEFRRQAADRMNNTDMAAYINMADIRSLEIALPPITEQQAVAEVLSALDDKIAANTRLAHKLAELASAHFSGTYQRASDPRPLAELVSTQYGVTTSAHNEIGPKFLRVTDINKKPWIEWATTPHCTMSDAGFPKYRVAPGDIVVARMADPGKAAFIDEGDPEAVFASYLVRLRAKDPGLAMFIYYFLRSADYSRYAAGAAQGSVQKNMNARIIVGTEMSTPSSQDLSEFNAVVGSLRRCIQNALHQNSSLAATRDTLLPLLMSGKLGVTDTESLVSAAM